MTTYVAVTSGSLSLSLLAVTHPLRIGRVEVKGMGAGSGNVPTAQVLRYTGASHSGGSVVTPQPMRAGAPAAVATARSGATTAGSSAALEHVTSNPPEGGFTPIISPIYAPPFDLTLDPGMALRAVVSGSSAFVNSLLIYFEELRQLSWPL